MHPPTNGCQPIRWSLRSIASPPPSPGWSLLSARSYYPAEKLDIKSCSEPGDNETHQGSRLQLGPPFEIVVAPNGGPRTKPKALNAALMFVRGKFVAVFDAEDRPERDQLRLALEAFTANRRAARLRAGAAHHRQHRR